MDKKDLSEFKGESEVTEDDETLKEREDRQGCPDKVKIHKSRYYFVKAGGE